MDVSAGDLAALIGIAAVVAFWWWRRGDDGEQKQRTDKEREAARKRKQSEHDSKLLIARLWQWLWKEDTADLGKISPGEFEQLVARLYERMGYEVRPTQQSRDGGVDLYAKRARDAGTEEIAVECKHYPNRTVGVVPLRALYGVVTSQPQLTRGVLVTSGSFSRDACKFVDGKRMDLIAGERLCELLTKYDLEDWSP